VSASIEYVEIAVSDLQRSVGWYEEMLGVRAQPDEGTIRLIDAGGDARPSGWIGDDLQRGVRHIAFKVADVDAHAGRLHRAGVEFTVEPMDATGGVRITFFFDPDGNLVELVQGAVGYHRAWSPEIVAREQATLPGPDDPPRFDHVAVTVGDLDATLGLYRDTLGFDVVGQLFFENEQQFVITYLQGGVHVLELFSYGVPTLDPWPMDGNHLGVRALGIAADGPPMPARDPDGVRLEHAG
jgi:catechol 2,3-dioxygenase-like lactoylglutathione lyase family enzyme